MDRPEHIRNPIEWGFDQVRLAALAVGSLGHSLRGSEGSRSTPLPTIRRIKATDLKDVLARGVSDFEAFRSDVVFLCLMYPIIGIALVWLTFGYKCYRWFFHSRSASHSSARLRLSAFMK
jgi:hypothetical protein